MTEEWHLGRVEIVGFKGDASCYLDLYCIRSGEVFHLSFHESSINAIKKALYDEGFLNAYLTEEIIRNDEKKEVLVKILINQGCLHTISDVIPRFYGSVNKKLSVLHKAFNEEFCRNLVGKQCSRIVIKCARRAILKKLSTLNLETVDLVFKKRKIHDGVVEMVCDVCLGRTDSSILYGASDLLEHKKKSFPAELISSVIKNDLIGKKSCQRIDNSTAVVDRVVPISIVSAIAVDENGQILKELSENMLDDNSKVIAHKTLERLAESFIESYVREGFWDASVKNIHLHSCGRNKCYLRVVINRGKCRILRSINIISTDSDENLSDYVRGSVVGEVLDPFIIDRKKREIEQLCCSAGRLNASVRVTVDERVGCDDEKDVYVNFYVTLAQKAYFGQITVSSDSDISKQKIASALSFAPGDEWDFGKLEQSRKRLDSFGVFKSVHVAQSFSEYDSNIPITITIHKDLPYEANIKIGGTFGSVLGGVAPKHFLDSAQFELGSSFIAKNPFGVADKVECSVELKRNRQFIRALYSYPRFVNLPVKLQAKSFACWKPYSDLTSLWSGDGRIGMSAGVWREWGSGTAVGADIGCEWTGRRGLIGGYFNWIPSFVIDAGFSLEKLSGNWLSRSGHAFVGYVKGVIPFVKQPNDVKFCFEAAWYWRVFGVGVFVVRGDYILHRSNLTIMQKMVEPIQTVMAISFPPRSDHLHLSLRENDSFDFSRRSGVGEMALYTELRLPIYKQFAGVLFYKITALRQKKWDFTSRLVSFWGLGLRYITPFGLVCADVGSQTRVRRDNGNRLMWRVGLGQIF
ncbi:hypothetical protein KAU11_01175 [Candidatus Babeliales bacterium]|nr:hypothetical protein [Candidatus Babeliales bacterium]